ncbi:MAG: hypothetical protein JHC82_01820 [Stenotrophomonas sp.]|nr:hypothetical protein [Stenotrophomonas sp.]
MSRVSLTDVQATNLYQLQTICLALQHDALAACRHFDLDKEQSDHLLRLSVDQMWTIVADVGEQTLFPPRPDLLKLLQCPAALTAPLAASFSRRLPPRG